MQYSGRGDAARQKMQSIYIAYIFPEMPVTGGAMLNHGEVCTLLALICLLSLSENRRKNPLFVLLFQPTPFRKNGPGEGSEFPLRPVAAQHHTRGITIVVAKR
jgi:hypothetical protein